MVRDPGYCLRRPTGQACVRLGGRMFYLGEYNSDESRAMYATPSLKRSTYRNNVESSVGCG
jgi:hypothetical protein